MTTYRLYTGPTLVQNVAQRLREHGFFNVFEGTEHVFFNAHLDRFAAWQQLLDCHVTGFRFNEFQAVSFIA